MSCFIAHSVFPAFVILSFYDISSIDPLSTSSLCFLARELLPRSSFALTMPALGAGGWAESQFEDCRWSLHHSPWYPVGSRTCGRWCAAPQVGPRSSGSEWTCRKSLWDWSAPNHSADNAKSSWGCEVYVGFKVHYFVIPRQTGGLNSTHIGSSDQTIIKEWKQIKFVKLIQFFRSKMIEHRNIFLNSLSSLATNKCSTSVHKSIIFMQFQQYVW